MLSLVGTGVRRGAIHRHAYVRTSRFRRNILIGQVRLRHREGSRGYFHKRLAQICGLGTGARQPAQAHTQAEHRTTSQEHGRIWFEPSRVADSWVPGAQVHEGKWLRKP